MGIPAAAYDYYSSDDESGIQMGAERTEGDLLFSNSGYGVGGMLPGLAERDPAATPLSCTHEATDKKPSTSSGENGAVGQATIGLRSLKAKLKGKGSDLLSNSKSERKEAEVERNMEKLNLK